MPETPPRTDLPFYPLTGLELKLELLSINSSAFHV